MAPSRPDASTLQKRRAFMAHKHESDLPDYLLNDPYLPLSPIDEELESPGPTRSKAGFSQTPTSKLKPMIIALAFVIIILFYIFSSIYKLNVLQYFIGRSCLNNEPSIPPVSYPGGDVDWSRYAYTQYVTNTEYLCNSVMLFETLDRLGSRADRLMLYPTQWSTDATVHDTENRLLQKAKDEYGVKLVPVDVSRRENSQKIDIWRDSLTKLLAFNQTQYERLLVLDSDASILQHMDELFFIPPCAAAMPRAYWLFKPTLASHIMLIQPSAQEFTRVQKAIEKTDHGVYDMEIINKLYAKECVLLPHRGYGLLTGEFRKEDHRAYLGNEEWDPETVIKETKYVHFSDHPLPKPWEDMREEDVLKAMPGCEVDSEGGEDCRSRDIWLELYRDFRGRVKVSFCGVLLGDGN